MGRSKRKRRKPQGEPMPTHKTNGKGTEEAMAAAAGETAVPAPRRPERPANVPTILGGPTPELDAPKKPATAGLPPATAKALGTLQTLQHRPHVEAQERAYAVETSLQEDIRLSHLIEAEVDALPTWYRPFLQQVLALDLVLLRTQGIAGDRLDRFHGMAQAALDAYSHTSQLRRARERAERLAAAGGKQADLDVECARIRADIRAVRSTAADIKERVERVEAMAQELAVRIPPPTREPVYVGRPDPEPLPEVCETEFDALTGR